MLFDPTNTYHRYMLHYESEQQLSLPEIIAQGSVDTHTAAILWYMLEHRASVLVSGPTDPTPGVGKTTTLNSLLPFYPSETGFVYTIGMYEEFAFESEVPPQETTVLANEISNHLRIYMWGRVARRLLQLPEKGFAVATTCHADTLKDVMTMLTSDLKIPAREIRNIQLIVNIGIERYPRPSRRRWLTTHFVLPNAEKTGGNGNGPVATQMVSAWDATSDTFVQPDANTIAALAAWIGDTPQAFTDAIAKREACLRELADARADQDVTTNTVQAFRAQA